MKISIIGPVYPYRGGISHYNTALIDAIKQEGHTVQILSFRRQYPSWLYPGKSDKDPSKNVRAVDAEYVLDPLNPLSWFQAASRIINNFSDLVIIQWWTPFWSLAFCVLTHILKNKSMKTLYLIHNVLPHERHMVDVLLTRLAFKSVNFYFVQTEKEKQLLRTLKPNSEIIIHPHPVYLPRDFPLISKKEARRQLGIPLLDPVILFFGIVRPYKGLDILIEALGLLRKYHTPPLLLVAGEIWQGKNYAKRISQLELERFVLFDNRYIPDEIVPLYFYGADLFVAPYITATQSGAVKLALGYGLPVIMSEAVATDSALKENDAIKIVQTANPQALEHAISQWLIGEWNPQLLRNDELNWRSLAKKIVSAF